MKEITFLLNKFIVEKKIKEKTYFLIKMIDI